MHLRRVTAETLALTDGLKWFIIYAFLLEHKLLIRHYRYGKCSFNSTTQRGFLWINYRYQIWIKVIWKLAQQNCWTTNNDDFIGAYSFIAKFRGFVWRRENCICLDMGFTFMWYTEVYCRCMVMFILTIPNFITTSHRYQALREMVINVSSTPLHHQNKTKIPPLQLKLKRKLTRKRNIAKTNTLLHEITLSCGCE